jgi:hypothetical protein
MERSVSIAENPNTPPGSRTSSAGPRTFAASFHSRTRPRSTTKTSAAGSVKASSTRAPPS